MKKTSVFFSIVLLVFLTGNAWAAPVTVNGLTFSEVSADVTIDGGIAIGNEVKLWETVTGLDVTISIRGLPQYGNPDNIGVHRNAFWLTKVVTNATGVAWNFYDHELQSVLGVPSTDGDGLSFAQGTGSVRPWTSDKFASVDEVVDVRDYINFYNGIVNPGDTVEFRYAISHNGSATPVYLRQRPNFSTVPEPGAIFLMGTGLVGLMSIRRRKK